MLALDLPAREFRTSEGIEYKLHHTQDYNVHGKKTIVHRVPMEIWPEPIPRDLITMIKRVEFSITTVEMKVSMDMVIV